MNKWKRWSLIGCGGMIGLLILMGSCVAIIAENTVYIDMAEQFKANDDGTVKIHGKTNAGAAVSLYQGSLYITKGKADDKGNFSLEITTDPNTKTKYKVKSVDGDVSEEKEITVIGPEIPTVKLSVESPIKTTKDQTMLEGTTEPGAKVELKQGDKVIGTKKADSEGNFSFSVKTNENKSFTVTSEKEGFIAETATVEVERVLSEAEKKAKYKKSCKTISYKQLKKNPDKYAGERYKARGQILQIMEGFGQTEMRIAVTKNSWGWNVDDAIYVTYDGTTDFVEEDVVTIYGEVTGSYSYTSIAGWEITVPGVDAKYIEK